MTQSIALLAVLALPALALAQEQEEPYSERAIEAKHTGRKLVVTNIRNPEFLDWTELTRPYSVVIKTREGTRIVDLDLLAVIGQETGFRAKVRERMWVIANGNRFDSRVLAFIQQPGNGVPTNLSGEAKTQLCAVLEAIEDAANMAMGTSRFGTGIMNRRDTVAYNLRLQRTEALSEWKLDVSKTRPTPYPCN